jgi:hypothetical protein
LDELSRLSDALATVRSPGKAPLAKSPLLLYDEDR